MEKLIKIFDTTLRDGEQAPGCSMNLGEKLELAKQLEKLNVDVIEAGFAVASPGDFKSVKEISKLIKNSTVASLSRSLKKDIDVSWEAVKYAKYPRIHTFIATSDIHMKYKLKKTHEEILTQAREIVKYAKTLCNDIEFSAEDASRSNPKFLYQVLEAVIKAGATTINIPDTVGYSIPEEFARLIKGIKENVSGIDNVDLSVHCHNDLGLGVANSLVSIKEGITQIECTINGIGERAGNAAMEEIVMALHTRKDLYNFTTNINTKQIYRTSKLVSSFTGIHTPPNKAIVGENAFSHESGIHQHGVLENRNTYEIMTPESVGVSKNNLVLGKHSGKHAFEDRLIELGFTDLNQDKILKAFKEFKILADKKKNIFDEDLEALVQDKSIKIEEHFILDSFNIFRLKDSKPSAEISLIKDGVLLKESSFGDGPVDASYNAISKIVGDNFSLNEYKLKAITGGTDALAEVLVQIEKDGILSKGRGLSTDVVEASIKAYIFALNKIFL